MTDEYVPVTASRLIGAPGRHRDAGDGFMRVAVSDRN
jgi:hypothetical protein